MHFYQGVRHICRQKEEDKADRCSCVSCASVPFAMLGDVIETSLSGYAVKRFPDRIEMFDVHVVWLWRNGLRIWTHTGWTRLMTNLDCTGRYRTNYVSKYDQQLRRSHHLSSVIIHHHHHHDPWLTSYTNHTSTYHSPIKLLPHKAKLTNVINI
jgi:hypothetical protein